MVVTGLTSMANVPTLFFFTVHSGATGLDFVLEGARAEKFTNSLITRIVVRCCCSCLPVSLF